MRINKTLQQVFVVTVGLGAYAAAHADNCTGRVNNVAITGDSIEVSKGHSVAVFSANSIATSENSINNTAGKCMGYALTTPDGKTRLVGACARKNKDGDTWSDEWTLEPGAARGTWKMSGGTGVFAGKSWSGWWEPISDDGKVFMGRWGGNCN